MGKNNKNSKWLIIAFVLAIIVIIVMAYLVYELYNEKENKAKEVENFNNKVTMLENTIDTIQKSIDEISSTNTIMNDSVPNTNVATTDNSDNKYKNLTEKDYNQISDNEYFSIQNVTQNSDETITLQGRIYEEVKLTSISKDEYSGLKNSGNITLFGEKFLLGEYEDFIPGYSLKNSNGYGFYVTDNYQLVNFNDTRFVKGTDKYYTIILDKNVKLKLPSGTEETIKVPSFATINDYNFINTGGNYQFKFNNGKVSEVIYEI